jgi:hypothetical protein
VFCDQAAENAAGVVEVRSSIAFLTMFQLFSPTDDVGVRTEA